jgi:Amidohydrolase family
MRRTPPIGEMLQAGLSVGAGTDATRVASYNSFVSPYWLVSGETVGGRRMYDDSSRLNQMEARRLGTVGSSWFSTEEGRKGSIVPGQPADLAVLSDGYFAVGDENIKSLESVLTIVGGKPVFAAEEFRELDPAIPPILPDWSPVAIYGGYARPATVYKPAPAPVHARQAGSAHRCKQRPAGTGFGCFC